MEILYYPEYDVAYITLLPDESADGCVAQTVETSDANVYLDYLADGRLFGIDLHSVSEVILRATTDTEPKAAPDA